MYLMPNVEMLALSLRLMLKIYIVAHSGLGIRNFFPLNINRRLIVLNLLFRLYFDFCK
jgi:hypothetical protein